MLPTQPGRTLRLLQAEAFGALPPAEQGEGSIRREASDPQS